MRRRITRKRALALALARVRVHARVLVAYHLSPYYIRIRSTRGYLRVNVRVRVHVYVNVYVYVIMVFQIGPTDGPGGMREALRIIRLRPVRR